ncbi:MAG TPA: transcriptional activator RfaH [Magnetovibrio sp.]
MTWFVVRTRSREEDRAAKHLRNQGFEVYLPRYLKQIRHARKTEQVLRPLFPTYLFVRMDLENARWRSIDGTLGVISLVKVGNHPQPVASVIVEAIRAEEDKDGAVRLAPKGLRRGDVVRVSEGAFADCTGLLEEVNDGKRAVLLLALLGREVRVRAPLESLVKAS